MNSRMTRIRDCALVPLLGIAALLAPTGAVVAADAGPVAGAPGPSLAITVYGGNGQIGRRIVEEALARGHRVTVVSRHPPPGGAPRERLSQARGDILDGVGVARQLAGQDAVVDATSSGAGFKPEGEDFHPRAARTLVGALRGLGAAAPRLLVVGGAGSLEVGPGRTLIDTMPMLAHGEPLGARMALEYYRTVTDVAWAFVSPSLQITPGTRTGRFRIGEDTLLRDAAGDSRISMEDFAVAVLDEIEHPAHLQRRFTVGY
jgi:putative NADH-flavin reductase